VHVVRLAGVAELLLLLQCCVPLHGAVAQELLEHVLLLHCTRLPGVLHCALVLLLGAYWLAGE
jgi:hypothetical protein